MIRLRLITFIFLQITCFSYSIGQTKADSIDAYHVINMSIEAMGGKEYLLSIQTLYTDMRTEMEGRQVHWIVKEMRPNKGSFQVVYNKKVVYQNWFDGKNGFEIVGGQKKPVDPEEFKDKAFKKNIFNELDYVDSSLWTLDLAGTATVNGEQCYKIQAKSIDGSERLLYYSKGSFLLLKEEKTLNPEKDSFRTVFFSGYKKFGRLTYYTEMRLGDNGAGQIARIEKLLVNSAVSVHDFK